MSNEPTTIIFAVEITAREANDATAALHAAVRHLGSSLPDNTTHVNAMAFLGLSLQDVQEAHQAREAATELTRHDQDHGHYEEGR